MSSARLTLPDAVDFPLTHEARKLVAGVWLHPLSDDWAADFCSRLEQTHRACRYAKPSFAALDGIASDVLQPLIKAGMDLSAVIKYIVVCLQHGNVSELRLPTLAGSTTVLRIQHRAKLAWLAAQILGAIESDPPLRKTPRLGCMSLHRLWACPEPLAIARLQAIWMFWWQLASFPEDQRLQNALRIERHSMCTTEEEWFGSTVPLGHISISSELRIEDAAARTCSTTSSRNLDLNCANQLEGAGLAVVDFANKQLHIGKVIPSCTQEEVMFSVRPEAYLGIPLCATMEADEVITIRGARQVCDYTGYGSGFRVGALQPAPTAHGVLVSAAVASAKQEGSKATAGAAAESNLAMTPVTPLPPFLLRFEEHVPAVLAMDASWLTNPKRQFRKEAQLRDLNKALASFSSVVLRSEPPSKHSLGVFTQAVEDTAAAAGGHSEQARPVVCSGKWGCGVFNGDPVLKVLQQWAAASLAGVDLCISTFGQPQQARQLNKLTQHVLQEAAVNTVGGLLTVVQAYGDSVVAGTAAVDGLAALLIV